MPKLTRLPLVSSSPRSLTGADPAGAIPRFAAVSPTFGRLFEGTDLNTTGQTTAFHQRAQFTDVTAGTVVKRHAEFWSAMLQNGGQPCRNLLASANAVSVGHGPQDKPYTTK